MYENIFKTHDCMHDRYKTMLLKHDRHPTLNKLENLHKLRQHFRRAMKSIKTIQNGSVGVHTLW